MAREPLDDNDAEPLMRFLARYSPSGPLPVDMALALSLANQQRPGVLSLRADKEEIET